MTESSPCEVCRELLKDIKTTIHRTDESCISAHKRIDEVQQSVAEMRTDVAKIRGQMEPLNANVEKITSAIIENGLSTGKGQPEVLIKVLDTIKWLIVASVIGGTIAAIGFYGVNISAKSQDQQLEIRGE